MTSTGTYGFDPNLGSIVLQAFQMLQIRPTELTQEHFQSARMAASLIGAEWSGRAGVNLWKVELVTTPLVQGQAVYSYDPSIVTILDAYISTANGDGTYTDRIILPISRSEYATYPQKSQQGLVTVYFPDRLLNPTITLWAVPDGTQTSLSYYCMRQIQDMAMAGGATTDLPNYFLRAFTLALAADLAISWSTPDRAAGLKALADQSYAIAVDQNTEAANVYMSPTLSSYYRN
jgi:hypothetical protein